MKIAVATTGLEVSPYLEICDYYVIFEEYNGKIIDEESVSARSHNPGYLIGQEIKAIIAGSMDRGSIKFFQEREIDVCIDVTGDAVEAVKAYIQGELRVLEGNYQSEELNPEPHDCKYESHE